MEKIYFKEHNENKNNIVFDQENESYKIKIDNIEYTFKFSNPEEFFYFLGVTKKIVEIYNSNKEESKFYIDKIHYDNGMIYEDLVLDNSWINDTTYLSSNSLLKTIDDNLPEDYVNFLNIITQKHILGDYFDKIKNVLVDKYAEEIRGLYNKNKLILKKIFEKHSFIDFYEDYKYYSLWKEKEKPEILLAKKFYNTISNEKLSKPDIFSLVLLNYLLDGGYKIKEIQDLRAISNTYSSNIEFNYLKNLFPRNVKVKYFDENYNTRIRYLKFVLENSNVKIIGITKNKEETDIGIIKLPEYYRRILEKSRN